MKPVEISAPDTACMETSTGESILLQQRRRAVQPTEALISIPNASDMVGRCCFCGLEWRAGSCHLPAVQQVKAAMAARPVWCTMSWMPAKMSPLQTSHISDGPFNSHRVERRPNARRDTKRKKKKKDDLVSFMPEIRVKRLEIYSNTFKISTHSNRNSEITLSV